MLNIQCSVNKQYNNITIYQLNNSITNIQHSMFNIQCSSEQTQQNNITIQQSNNR